MKLIWKFELEKSVVQCLKMPLDAEIFCLQVHNKNPCLWCFIDVEKPKAAREIRILCTGHPIENKDTGKYIGTYQSYDGDEVFHVFDHGYE